MGKLMPKLPMNSVVGYASLLHGSSLAHAQCPKLALEPGRAAHYQLLDTLYDIVLKSLLR